jgi:vitamin B12 transporter
VQANLRNDRDSQFGAYQTGALAYAYAIEPRLRFTASTATAFKAPTLEQIYSQYGDLNLQPETNRSNELGLGFSQGPHNAKLVVYRNSISNMISSGMTSTNCVAGWFCYYNVNQATIEGVTLSGATRLGRFGVSGSVDVVEPRNDATGKVLSLRARQMAKFGVDTVWAQWTVGAEILDVGPRFDNASNTVSSGGYDVISLSASRPVAKDWKLLLRVNNLLDQKYQQVDGIAAPGATVFAGIQWAPGH